MEMRRLDDADHDFHIPTTRIVCNDHSLSCRDNSGNRLRSSSSFFKMMSIYSYFNCLDMPPFASPAIGWRKDRSNLRLRPFQLD